MSNPSELDRAVIRAFTALCWEVATPVAYKAVLALKREDWLYLSTIKVDSSHYRCARSLSGDLQVATFFKKYPDFDLGIDLKKKAIESFWQSERQCYQANERLAPLTHDIECYGEDVSRILRKVRKKVSLILGRVPKWSELSGKFGPGSTFRDVGPYITVPDKMSSKYTLTQSARVTMEAWDRTAWSRYAAAGLVAVTGSKDANTMTLPGFEVDAHQDGFELVSIQSDAYFSAQVEEIVRGNRFTTVPKDAHKLRGICIEPSINLFYQLAIGAWMERRMNLTLGWYKSTQQEFHKLLARLGSLTGLSATIDLSNASDTVCKMLVKLLLPRRWYELLCAVRSDFTFISGKWVRLEKFSSMGNGFTFELETLLFRAIVEVASEGSRNCDFLSDIVSTFGDDIICPADRAGDVIALLDFVGLKTNKDKTFLKGGFRESCGGDYFRGFDVRPHYLKENPSEPHQYIALANGLRRFGIRHILCGGPDVYRKPWLRILDQLPSQIRDCRGPKDLGDIVIWDEESNWRYKERESRRYFRCWRPVAYRRTPWSHFRPGVVLASALYGTGDGRAVPVGSSSDEGRTLTIPWLDSGGVATRVNGSYVSGYRFGRVCFS